MRSNGLWRECVAEVLGTFILVLFGAGSVHVAVLTGAQSGPWQVAVGWGIAVALAIYAVGAVSGAHINPAMTLAFTVFRRFPVRKLVPYVLAQLVGAFIAAAALYALFGGVIAQFETAHQLVRGQPGSELSAMVYGEYFPNPAIFRTPEAVPEWTAMLGEGLGTAMLAFFVFALTDRHNPGRPGGALFPLLIGLAVAIIISIVAPLTQAGLNPARDFGPRLFSYLAGWGGIAIPGPRGGFLAVYVLSPLVGGVIGAAGYEFLLHSAMKGGQAFLPAIFADKNVCATKKGDEAKSEEQEES
jgi:glycerol uptake facilitator protein